MNDYYIAKRENKIIEHFGYLHKAKEYQKANPDTKIYVVKTLSNRNRIERLIK